MRLQSGKLPVWALAAYQLLGGRQAYVGARVEGMDGVTDCALDASADTAWRSRYFHWWAKLIPTLDRPLRRMYGL
jgi:hypothetical protein